MEKSLKEGETIEFNSEKLLLLNTDGPEITYIDHSNEDEKDIDLNAKVFIKQRWKVVVLAEDKFSKDFTTHRHIRAFKYTYREHLEQQERIYTARDVNPHKDVDSNTLSDNYGELY
jgi:hypothetical protein